MKTIVALLSLLLCISFAYGGERTLIAHIKTPRAYKIIREASFDEVITFRVLLKQRNLDVLDKSFWEVSDPTNKKYGKFMTREEIDSLIAPDPLSVKRVISWLLNEGVSFSNMNVFNDHIVVKTPVSLASKIFQTNFFVFQSQKGKKITRIQSKATIPSYIREDIDFIVGLSEFLADAHRTPVRHTPEIPSQQVQNDITLDTLQRYFAPRNDKNVITRHTLLADNPITPSVLIQYYNITLNPQNITNGANNSQAIAAFDDYFSVGALKSFDTALNIPFPNVTRVGDDCLNTGGCDQYESDLDIQYITSLAQGVNTFFYANTDGDWILEWAQLIYALSSPPLVHSISYGWTELEQCDVTDACDTYGYNSTQYVDRTNTELSKLGNLGITVMVADGDDGSPGFYASSGNCPIDPNNYCPAGGCAHTSSSCSDLIFNFTSNGTNYICIYPMGIASDACQAALSSTVINNAFASFVTTNSGTCTIDLDRDNEGAPHIYSSCTCDALTSVTYQPYVISGDVFSQSNGPIFTADFPASSPYITSVGATQFLWSGSSVSSEVVASITTGSSITTGGGFSSYQTSPDFQQSAIQSYLQNGVNIPPSWSFNPKNRGYPDVVFNGHYYVIYASNNTADFDQCPCLKLAVDGTSCASPAFSGIVSLINGQILAQGGSPLGPLNTLLYQMAVAAPQAFNKISSGNNNCNRIYCCQYGYSSSPNAIWTPSSGLGSPNYPQFLKYALSAKQLN